MFVGVGVLVGVSVLVGVWVGVLVLVGVGVGVVGQINEFTIVAPVVQPIPQPLLNSYSIPSIAYHPTGSPVFGPLGSEKNAVLALNTGLLPHIVAGPGQLHETPLLVSLWHIEANTYLIGSVGDGVIVGVLVGVVVGVELTIDVSVFVGVWVVVLVFVGVWVGVVVGVEVLVTVGVGVGPKTFKL